LCSARRRGDGLQATPLRKEVSDVVGFQVEGGYRICPAGTKAMFRRDGEARCACPAASTCVGDACLFASFKRDGTRVAGYPPSCKSCFCQPSGLIAEVGGRLGTGKASKTGAAAASIPSAVRPRAPGSTVTSTPTAAPQPLSPADAQTLKRRECAQSALYTALGFDYNEEYEWSTPVCKQRWVCEHCAHAQPCAT
jgi:hypothetical protein